MDADGGNQQNLTNNPHDDWSPSWFNSPFSVSAPGKKSTMWGLLKQPRPITVIIGKIVFAEIWERTRVGS